MKKIFRQYLAWVARLMIGRYSPEVIAITGSVGKTSVKEAVWTVLEGRGRIRKSEKNLNTEIGVPLTILGAKPAKSAGGWMAVALRAIGEVLTRGPRYPETLILEMAADRPGDIEYLTSIARPKIAVLTAISPAHTEFFSTIEALAEEKATILRALPEDGVAVISRDNDLAWEKRGKTKARVISFGFHEEADVRAVEADLVSDGGAPSGVVFKILYQGSAAPVHIAGVVGRGVIQAALAAAAVGLAKGMNLVGIAEALGGFDSPPGRMRIIPGIKNTTIIDDTYNASPASAQEALQALRVSGVGEGARKIAVLGDMLELGALSVESHRSIGKLAAGSGIDLLVTVGERVRDLGAAAREAGFPEDRLEHFKNADEAGRYVQEKLRQGDLVLVKASRGMHLEAVVRELMAEPLKADDLLVSGH
ncbi:hypothetical protein A3F28_02640 [Candidatus Uhrbacteria bacterium RIFCSPHIGHO2_12_FULL_57_11]|uniref:UDP-N-acetylmuramoyl-tripeptide--D-alanyl-D-alanine ligase n=2 Tax=Candidatus Uhriibacteriota TaxID=1752732 RepID=A0A1F7UMB3_9BACT|nr:MAG: hypothetical protein A3D72_02585 [Candidatus Uhrbacteria bacterium RIFCSPHIGHO2_02_FULL_57_19]OGL78837.1 MAG: hypothetical protein A3F28_02640 [Candidatus Uhrbacteria bacterium RIFCSPHIGHO2_12_FULL_57_11]